MSRTDFLDDLDDGLVLKDVAPPVRAEAKVVVELISPAQGEVCEVHERSVVPRRSLGKPWFVVAGL